MPRAMGILEGLEEGAASAPDPTGHVLAVAAEGGGVQEIPPAAEPAAPGDRLRRRIAWMNSHSPDGAAFL